MKELSIEEKARRYDEAIERAKNTIEVNRNIPDIVECVESLFPALKESEDERIRENIIATIHLYYGEPLEDEAKEMIDWLEKQVKNISLPKFTFGDVLALQCAMEAAKKVQKDKDLYEQLESLHNRLHDAYWLEKQGQQKPTDIQSIEKRAHEVFPDDDDENTPLYRQAFIGGAVDYIDCGCKNTEWSEEDERLCLCLIEDQEEALDKVRNDKYGHSEIISDLKEMYHERINFLKSLKDRYTWKPSDEQMKALAYAVFDTQSHSYHKNLSSLEQQLKKLREK